MPMIRAMRLLNAVEAGTTTGAQLQTLLNADAGRLAEWNVLMGMRGQTRRMATSSTAMTAVAASSTAMTAVIASSTAMAAVIASSTAMAAVIASSTAMTAVAASSTAMAAVAASSTAMAAVIASSTAMAAVAASSTAMAAVNANDQALRMWLLAGTGMSYSSYGNAAAAKMAVFASDSILGALAASPEMLTRWRAATGYAVYSSSAVTAAAITGPSAGGSYIVLGVSSVNAPNATVNTLETRRSGSAIATTTTSDGTSLASTALKYPKAIPLVAPFTSAQTGGGYTWYFGMLRCDV